MPVRKLRLSSAEEVKHLARLKELCDAGLDSEVSKEALDTSRALDIVVGGCPASLVIDLPPGGVGYAVWIRLVARRSGVILLGCEIQTKYDDQIVLSSLAERRSVYKLGWLEYLPDEVLNQRIENTLEFHRSGQMVEGMILALGLKPIPADYRQGMSVPFTLTFTDQFDVEFGVEAELSVDRTVKRRSPPLRPKGGLYAPAGNPAVSQVVAREDAPRAHDLNRGRIYDADRDCDRGLPGFSRSQAHPKGHP